MLCTAQQSGIVNWHVPCFSFTNDLAAVLEPTRLAALAASKAQLPAVSDWETLIGQSRAALQSVFLDVPKVIHQIWLGTNPVPAVLDTFR